MVQPQKNLNYSQKDKISARESKFYRKDGLTLKINQSRLDFTNPVYKSRIKNGSIKQEFMWGIGISIVASPAILYYDLTQNTYRIRVADTELSILYGTFDISYDEDFKEFDLFNVAHDIGMSFIVFPRIPFVTPIIGAGLQLSKLKFFNLKDENGWDVDPIDEKMYVNTSDLYAKAGLGFNIGAYSLDFYMKKSLLSKDRAWERWQVNLGFDICY